MLLSNNENLNIQGKRANIYGLVFLKKMNQTEELPINIKKKKIHTGHTSPQIESKYSMHAHPPSFPQILRILAGELEISMDIEYLGRSQEQ